MLLIIDKDCDKLQAALCGGLVSPSLLDKLFRGEGVSGHGPVSARKLWNRIMEAAV